MDQYHGDEHILEQAFQRTQELYEEHYADDETWAGDDEDE